MHPEFFYKYHDHHRDLHSFPTRRSSDLYRTRSPAENRPLAPPSRSQLHRQPAPTKCCLDRKSTRLNSSHMSISYAVFCLKKKRRVAACYLECRLRRHVLPSQEGDARPWI